MRSLFLRFVGNAGQKTHLQINSPSSSPVRKNAQKAPLEPRTVPCPLWLETRFSIYRIFNIFCFLPNYIFPQPYVPEYMSGMRYQKALPAFSAGAHR
jgi:hypothetical protein